MPGKQDWLRKSKVYGVLAEILIDKIKTFFHSGNYTLKILKKDNMMIIPVEKGNKA